MFHKIDQSSKTSIKAVCIWHVKVLILSSALFHWTEFVFFNITFLYWSMQEIRASKSEQKNEEYNLLFIFFCTIERDYDTH
jgi:hypothetical protein